MNRNILACVFCLGSGFLLGYLLQPKQRPPMPVVRVLTRVDTLVVREPAPVVARTLERRVEALPLAAQPACTVYVEVPREQRVYEGESFRAYVSGYRPSLDSLRLLEREVTVERTLPAAVRKPRFSVGLQAGYGYTPRGFQPYVGIGVSINIASR